jgi:hypothetical protein
MNNYTTTYSFKEEYEKNYQIWKNATVDERIKISNDMDYKYYREFVETFKNSKNTLEYFLTNNKLYNGYDLNDFKTFSNISRLIYESWLDNRCCNKDKSK